MKREYYRAALLAAVVTAAAATTAAAAETATGAVGETAAGTATGTARATAAREAIVQETDPTTAGRAGAGSFKQERRVWLWDVTLSMKGQSDTKATPDIWDEVKAAITNSIEGVADPTTEIIIIPFQDKVIDVWRATATPQGKAELAGRVKAFDTQTKTYTDIVRPMQKAMAEIMQPDRRNLLYLMTDGDQSDSEGSRAKGLPTQADLLRLIDGWCRWAETHDAYGLYIMLTDEAQNAAVADAIGNSCRMSFSKGTNIDFTELMIEGATVNLKDDGGRDLPLTLKANKKNATAAGGETHPLRDVRLHVWAHNRFFDIDTQVQATELLSLPLKWKAGPDELRQMLPLEAEETVTINVEPASEADYPWTVLLGGSVKIRLINKAEKRLRIYVE